MFDQSVESHKLNLWRGGLRLVLSTPGRSVYEMSVNRIAIRTNKGEYVGGEKIYG